MPIRERGQTLLQKKRMSRRVGVSGYALPATIRGCGLDMKIEPEGLTKQKLEHTRIDYRELPVDLLIRFHTRENIRNAGNVI